jgi:aspartyl-tRNA synthetase
MINQRVLALEALKKVGKKIILKGWVNRRRDHGQLIFIDLRDRSGIVQIVCDKKAKDLRDEYVIEIEGLVKKRPEKLINPQLKTGGIEVKAEKIKVLAQSQELPLPLNTDGRNIDEAVRLKYRYLDLRRQRLNRNLRLRDKVVAYIRKYMRARDFLEIETPFLSKSTPEGARDFIVPSRLQPGKFYALPQSPQQYKQLLMVAGLERYFQIVRCFRDEDPRADRAYGEFTQLDLEISFTSQEEILALTEQLMIELTEKIVGKKIYKKPFPRLTHAEAIKKFGADKFDLRAKKDPEVLAFAWVLDFPLFEKTKEREITSSHHPFTAPKDEDIPLLDKEPMKVRSWQHDLVCNGLEVGGGSLRITDPEIQEKIFEILGHNKEEIKEKFGHLLEAFKYGVPPHGGIAPGIDRLMMVFCNEPSTREVMAFPLTAGGQTAVMDAPGEVTADQLKELKLQIREKK